MGRREDPLEGPAASANRYPGLARIMRRFSDMDQLGRTRGLVKIYPGLSEARDEFLTAKTSEGDPLRCPMPCAVESAHGNDKLPSPRFARLLTGFYSAFQIQFWNVWDMGWPT